MPTAYREVPLDQLRMPEWSWHFDDEVVAHKLDGSLTLHGQLRAIVVRQVEGALEIVEGRALFQALRRAGRETATVVDLGPISRQEAILAALSLELRHEIDYVKLGRLVAELAAAQGVSFSSITPFTGVDIGYYTTLSANFDWSQFHEESRQDGFFDDEDPPAPVPIVVALAATPTAPQIPTKTGVGEATAARDRLAAVRDFAPVVGPTNTFVTPVAPAPPVAPVAPVDPWDEVPAPAIPQGGGIQFFGSEWPVSTWTPQEPPCLDGIDDIVLNFETSGLKWYGTDRPLGVTVGTLDGQLKRFLPFGFTGGNLDESVVKRWAERELRDKHITNAHTGFEVHMSRVWGVDLEEQGCTFSDVMHYAALLDDYRKQFALDVLVKDFLHEDGPPRVDESRMTTYHAGDVALRAEYQVEAVARLRDELWPLLDAEDLQRVRQLEDDVIPVVCEMEKNAAHVDRTALREMVERSAHALNESLWEVARDLGFSMNPDKNEDWQKLFAHYGIPITRHTEKGAPSFTDDFLKGIDHPKVQLARRAGKIASLRSKFLLPYNEVIGEDCKLRFALHQLRGDEYGTVRGRFSMSGGGRNQPRFGANLQQVMRVNSQREAFGFAYNDASHDAEIYLVRSLFIPEQGEYLSADAQSIEYRIAAHYAKATNIIEAYQQDVVQLREGRLPDKWVDFHKVVGDVIRPYKDLSRNIIKNANFCLTFGGRQATLASTLGVSRDESDQIYSVWHRMFPELSALPKTVENLARSRGYVKTLSGRRARFKTAEHMQWAHAAINYVIQGSAADVMKTKLVELHKERKSTGLVMRQTVHDEVTGDATTPETAGKVREILNRQSFPELRVPIVWEVETGKNWAEAH